MASSNTQGLADQVKFQVRLILNQLMEYTRIVSEQDSEVIPALEIIQGVVTFFPFVPSETILSQFVTTSSEKWSLLIKKNLSEANEGILEIVSLILGSKLARDRVERIMNAKNADDKLIISDTQRLEWLEQTYRMARTALEYIHQRRCRNPTTGKYTVPYLPEIKIAALTKVLDGNVEPTVAPVQKIAQRTPTPIKV